MQGAQVCVYHKGKPAASVCCGVLGKGTDPRPVAPDTLFCAFSVTKGAIATLLHMLVERAGKSLGYDDKVAELWPDFGCEGKEATTIKHVLCHQAGLQHALPPKLGLAELGDWEKCAAHLATAKPLYPPTEERSSYHYFTFGWLVGELCRRLDVDGRSVEKILADEIAGPLDIADEFMIGIGDRDGVDGRLATLSSSMVAGRNAARSEEIEELIKGVESEAEATRADGKVKGGVLPKLKQEAQAVGALLSSLKGREYLADPRIFNSKELRRAVVPAANGHFSARGLAKFYAALAGRGQLGGVRLLSSERMAAVQREWAQETGADRMWGSSGTTSWGLGYHRYAFVADGDGADDAAAFGHAGIGGSIGLCDPARELAVAVTVNHLTGSRVVAKRVMALVAEELRLGGRYDL